jgi:hypothetical protein
MARRDVRSAGEGPWRIAKRVDMHHLAELSACGNVAAFCTNGNDEEILLGMNMRAERFNVPTF